MRGGWILDAHILVAPPPTQWPIAVPSSFSAVGKYSRGVRKVTTASNPSASSLPCKNILTESISPNKKGSKKSNYTHRCTWSRQLLLNTIEMKSIQV